MTTTVKFRAVPASETAHPNLCDTREAAERYLAGYVDGGRIEGIEVDDSPVRERRVEQSYAGDARVLLMTRLAIEDVIADCRDWDEVAEALQEAAAQAGADKVGALTEYLGADGKLHTHRWLDGCKLQPSSQRLAGPDFYAAFTAQTRSGYRVAAVRHCVVG